MTVEFFGGPMDGAIMVIPDSTNHMEFPSPVPMPWPVEGQSKIEPIRLRRHVYRKATTANLEAFFPYDASVPPTIEWKQRFNYRGVAG